MQTTTRPTVTILHTTNRIANHATGETHPRHEVTVACACPACGDADSHPGVAYRGTTTATCGWCAHSWTVAA